MSTLKFPCFECNDEGFSDKVCPSCGIQPRSKSLNLEKKDVEEVKKFVATSKKLGIPPEYVGNVWSKTIFWRNNAHRKNPALEGFIEQLHRIHEIFVAKNMPKRSGIIIAPSTYSKTVWAYSCMSLALDAGFSVAPLLDTNEANRLVTLACNDKLDYKLYGELDYDTYVSADVMFVTVTKSHYRKMAYSVIRELLDRRSRMGLLTYVLSEYGLEEISAWDRTGAFMKITDITVDENKLKVPAVSIYKEDGFR